MSAVCPYIVGTAGHVDHGKSSLVQALTGTDPDRLPEEKARGLTIDLGFANLELPAMDGSGDTLSLGFVDVPGHADFVKNMVAGVGSLDLALLVVAADDGWMPQTEEHYQILTYLGVRRLIVVLTKTDLFEDLDLVRMDVHERLAGGPWTEAPVVLTSVAQKSGLDELKEEMIRALADLAPAHDVGKPRLPVDRVFALPGVGTVVTGTLINGSIEFGDDVVVQPGGATMRVREVQSHNRKQAAAIPGTRTALNLVKTSSSSSHAAVLQRGNIVTTADSGTPSNRIHVRLRMLGRPNAIRTSAGPTIKTRREVQFHYGSGSQTARVYLVDDGTLGPGESCLAELRFKTPVHAWAGDRFVLRDHSRGMTLAGGTVLDPSPPARSWRKVAQLEFLSRRADQPDQLETLVLSQVQRDQAIERTGLLDASPFAQAEIEATVKKLVCGEQILARAGWLLEPNWWREVTSAALSLLTEFHERRPDRVGLPLTKLRSAIVPLLPRPHLFDLLLPAWEEEAIVRSGPLVRHRDHQARLPAELVAVGECVRARLEADPCQPPNRGEVAPGADEEQVLRFLVETGTVVELNEKTVISRVGYESLRDAVVRYLQENERATASELRQAAGSNRRVFLPMLERLDNEGITVREDDHRRLRKSG